MRITGRLSLSYGIRYDRFGPPTSVGGAKDPVVSLGAGATEGERIAGATMSPAPSSSQKIYAADNVDWAVRTGASYALSSGGRTVVRGGYGIYYDRAFDNLWQSLRNNNWLQLEAVLPATGPINYLQPARLLDSLATLPVDRDAPDVTLYSSSFRTPRVHSAFAAIQHRLHERWFVEATVQASRSGDLVTTDRWNRQDSQATFTRDNPNARYNGALPDILYRANQGRSQYRAFTSFLRYQGSAALVQASYTLSNSHDNQSDPIAGEFYDLRANKTGLSSQATFARQFDPSSNWGHADFDQRHNLVLFGIWDLPRLARGWRVSALAAVRSGFPFTVLSPLIFGSPLLHNPANLVAPGAVSAGRVPVPGKGGVLLLNAAAFAPAGPVLGDSGRNRFYGPGLFNTDVSLSRRFGLRRFRESKAITIRADAFNILNHANLNNPNSSLGSPDFGVATYGRTARPQAFPLTTPFEETGRQVRGMLTFEF